MRLQPEVHWAEGMFLRPQHLQMFGRQIDSRVAAAAQKVQPFFWGVSAIEVAEDELENFRFLVRRFRAVLKDGTWLDLGTNLRVEPRDFKQALNRTEGRLQVYLGVPRLVEGSRNTLSREMDADGSSSDHRYRVDTVEVTDENRGGNRLEEIEVRLLAGRIFFEGEDREGYDYLPIASIQRTGKGKNTPVLADDFIPPVCDVSGWKGLSDLGASVLHRVEARYRSLHAGVDERRLVLEMEGREGWQLVFKLQIVGSFLHVLRQLLQVPGTHPFQLYLELSRLAGELSIFEKSGAEALPVPLYDHDRLGPCFRELTTIINHLLDKILTGGFLAIPFLEEKEDLLVARPDLDQLHSATAVYICVESSLKIQEIENLIWSAKFGTPDDLPGLKLRRLRGLSLKLEKETPRGLPGGEKYHYFAVEREEHYWKNVAQQGEVAITDADRRMRFSLYLVLPTGSDS